MRYHGRYLRKGRHSELNRAYLVTTVTNHREPVFNDSHCARIVINSFKHANNSGLVESLSWVVMPDHFHWLFTIKATSLSNVMRHVKGSSALKINELRGLSATVWQKGFHDHALRDEEDLKQISKYIVANPLRAGLVDDIGQYPHWDAVWL